MCMRCRRPELVCWCRFITEIPTRTRIAFLQHPRERDMAIGTARMASLCLPGSELYVGVQMDADALARVLGDPERPPVLLWPGEGAIDIAEHPPTGPVTLVVVDGTWSQAKKLVRDNPRIAALPRYAFTPRAPGEYRIRREPKENFVSTIEALVHVLGVLEGEPSRFEALMIPFRAMIDMQLEQHALRRRARVRKASRLGRRTRVPPVFLARVDELVAVVGEIADPTHGRAEPGDERPRELVQWVAQRLATGERFEAIVRPTIELTPGMRGHIAIAPERLDAGCTADQLRMRWQAFVRPDDVVCSWGQCASQLLLDTGGMLPRTRLDLRPIARALAKGRVGALESYHDALVLSSRPLGAGRAGRRLGMLVEVVRRMITIAREDSRPRIVAIEVESEDTVVVELDCGHRRHVRDRPPLSSHPWVRDADARARRIGAAIECGHCDAAPAGVDHPAVVARLGT
jgi:DTW domain-containing protein